MTDPKSSPAVPATDDTAPVPTLYSRLPDASETDNERTVSAALYQVGGDASSNTLPTGTRVNEFEILGLIGEGGFGIVYRALDHTLKRTIALKEYMPAAFASRTGLRVSVKSNQHIQVFLLGLRSFVNEAQILAQFDHPALIKVHRFCEANGTAYMAMPLIEGGTLKQAARARLDRGAPPDEAWLRKLLAPLLQALEVLHDADCVHRDISPDNILLIGGDAREPRPLLLDFGAARRVIGEQTQALTVILKPGFAPIEQYDEIPGMKQGPWTDLYALGAAVHFALTGRAPPPAVGRMVRDSYAPLADTMRGRCGAAFLSAVDRALAPHPELRPQSVAEFRTLLGALEPVRDPVTVAPETQPVTTPAWIAPARDNASSRLKWSVGAAVAVAVVFLTVIALWPDPPSPAPPQPLAVSKVDTPDPVATDAAPPLPAPVATDASEPVFAGAPVVETPPKKAQVRPRPRPLNPPAPAVAQPQKQGAIDSAATTSGVTPDGSSSPPATEAISADALRDGVASTPLWVRSALREGQQCLVARRFACTIEQAQAVLRADPQHPIALRMLRLARNGQEAALRGDWKDAPKMKER